MSGEKQYTDLKNYIADIRKSDIDKIAFAETNEKRAEQVDDSVLEVVHVKKLELLAYREGTIYKCLLADIDLDETYKHLVAEGFAVERVKRNIT